MQNDRRRGFCPGASACRKDLFYSSIRHPVPSRRYRSSARSAAVAWATGVQGVDRLELLLSGLLPAAYGCFMNALLLPLLYKFGSQKGRIYLLMVMGLGVGLIFATMAILKELNFSVSQFSLSLLALPPLGLLTLIPSYFLSRRIFFHKDL